MIGTGTYSMFNDFELKQTWFLHISQHRTIVNRAVMRINENTYNKSLCLSFQISDKFVFKSNNVRIRYLRR